jgi:hypothetical protein
MIYSGPRDAVDHADKGMAAIIEAAARAGQIIGSPPAIRARQKLDRVSGSN